MRGQALRDAIRAVINTFGAESDAFVFVGACVLGLYARPEGPPLRATKDVDCISTVIPWVLQEKRLANLCSRGVLSPDREVQCRYRITGTDVDVDVLSPEGMNVGAANPWFGRAAKHAREYDLGDGRIVRAISPPYFLATKLIAFADRGEDALSSTDAEDLVAAIVEVTALKQDIESEGLAGELGTLLANALARHHVLVHDLEEFVEAHLDRRDRMHTGRVVGLLRGLLPKERQGPPAEP
jgi:predicted nucleotidyltransferase